MAFNVNEFRAKIKGALASPANFRVLITGAVVDSDDSRTLALLCNQAQLPARQFATIDYTTHGPIMKMPYQNMYDDVVMSFYCKENMNVKGLFQEWQNFICDNNSTNEFSYLDSYTTDIVVEQFNTKGKTTYAIKLIDAYPLMVSPLQMDWATQNGFHNLQVTFAYRYWREEPVSASPFGHFLDVNNLYPNFDISGALETTGAALWSRADGQVSSKVQQGIGFTTKATGSLSGRQHSLSLSDKSSQNPYNDRHMIND